MLSKILSKEACANCKFCCSFKRTSLWETPVFSESEKNILEKKYVNSGFKKISEKSFTVDLSGLYKTEDEKEEAPCHFLDSKKGCILSKEEKPFDCMIWPLRVAKKEDCLYVVYEANCPVLNKMELEKIRKIVTPEFLDFVRKKISENPDIVKEWNSMYKELKML